MGRAGVAGFGWLALDRDDNDPIRFWTYVAAALHSVDAGLGGTALALLRVPGIRPVVDVVPVLINALAASARPVVLVLDDYHVITNPDIEEGMAFLVEHLPPSTEIVLASRTEPALPSARLRVQGLLTEIGPDQLRFTPADAAALLNDLHGPALDPDSVASLCSRTEGWAAGLYLAGLSLRDRPDRRGFVGDVAGYEGLVVDYLSDEVLAGQPERCGCSCAARRCWTGWEAHRVGAEGGAAVRVGDASESGSGHTGTFRARCEDGACRERGMRHVDLDSRGPVRPDVPGVPGAPQVDGLGMRHLRPERKGLLCGAQDTSRVVGDQGHGVVGVRVSEKGVSQCPRRWTCRDGR